MNALPSILHSFYCTLTSTSFPFIFQDSASFPVSDLIIVLDFPFSEVPHLPLASDGHFYFHPPAGTPMGEGVSKDAPLRSKSCMQFGFFPLSLNTSYLRISELPSSVH